MPSESDSAVASTILSSVRNVLTVRNLVMLLAGILAGAGIAMVGQDTVVLPFIGASSGVLVGGVSLLLGLVVYWRGSCRGDCASAGCGCSGQCTDSCSYNP